MLSGKLKGEVLSTGKVVLNKTAEMQGNIHTPTLVMDEGAVLEGSLTMGTVKTSSNSAQAEKNEDVS